MDARIQLPEGYYVVYGGQFESESKASTTIVLLTLVVVAGIFLLLFAAFHTVRDATLVMVNLPLAFTAEQWLDGVTQRCLSAPGPVTSASSWYP